jgi:hypothetical protein
MPSNLAPSSVCALLTLALPASAQSLIGLLPVGSPHDHAGDAFGRELTVIGDLDSDGHADLAVLATDDGSGAQNGPSWVRVVSGSDGRPLRTYLVGEIESLESLETIADFDGDGVADLLVGEPAYSIGGTERGRVRVISSRTGLQLFSKVGAAAFDHFGSAVADAGDVDGDGIPDVLAGAPGVAISGPGGGADKGRFYLYSGADGSVLEARSYGTGDAEFGTAIAVLDDVDGNGRPQIAVGAPGNGKVFTYELLGGSPTLTADHGGRFGEVVAAVGNFDGLGGRDLVASDPTYDDQYSSGGLLYTTPKAGRVCVLSSSTGSVLAEWSPASHSSEAGWQLLDAGDVTGDGVGDVLVSGRQPNGDAVSGQPQRFWVVSGISILLGSTEVESVFETFVANRDIARAGDRNGDGLEDFWFGRPFVSSLGDGAGAVELRSLASQELFVASGGHLGTGIGDALAVLDDLDGDGRAEVAVGAPHDGPGDVVSRGTVRVMSGDQLVWEAQGDIADELGAALALLDDLDGDGVRDLLVGAPFDTVGQGRPGRAIVHSGATGAVLRSHGGFAQGERFGDAVCAVPDVDGDGILDYAVAAPEASGSFLRQGRVELFSGATGATLWSLEGFGGRFGTAIAGSEDFDGDGAGDLLVGAPFEIVSIQAFGAGRVYRVSGATGTILGSQAGGQALMRLGSSVASAGDLSGDGVADYLVGAPLFNGTATDDGRVELRSGADDARLWSENGAVGSRLGASVAGLGDVNLDGVPDFAVGEPVAIDFATFLVKGRVRFYSGVDFDWFRSLTPTETKSRFGETLTRGGDLDGDGIIDVAVGAPLASATGMPACGRVFTYTQRPIGTEIYGQATASCAGEHGLIALDPIHPGDTLTLRFAGLEPGVIPILIGSFAPTPTPVPLPNGSILNVDLALLLQLELLPPATAEFVSRSYPVPNNPLLQGLTIYYQGAAAWPTLCPEVLLGLSNSRGLSVTIQ